LNLVVIKKVLLIGADKKFIFINYKDRATCIIFGDGAGAVLFEPNNEERFGVQDEYLRSNGEGREFFKPPMVGLHIHNARGTFERHEHYVFQDGKTVFKNAVFNMADVAVKILERNNLTNNDVAWLVAHQANKRIIDATANRINLEDIKSNDEYTEIRKYNICYAYPCFCTIMNHN
jgi:3-oxoacyl-[acyl-carrier-protein] synthase-3